METNFKQKIEKYSNEFAGKALFNFVNGCKVTYTKLGTYSQSTKGGKTDIVASGHQIFDVNDKSLIQGPVTVYTKTADTSLDKSKVFSSKLEATPKQILASYLDINEEIDTEVKKEVLQKLLDIDNKKCLVIPIIPKSECKINCVIDGNKKSRELATLKYLKWTTNKSTYRLECQASFSIKTNNGDKIVKFPMTEYGKTFITDKIDYWNGINNSTRTLIDMTDLGLLKPIEITNGTQSIVVDGTFIYWLHNGIVNVVGEWDNQKADAIINPDVVKAIGKSDIYKFFSNNITLICGHRNLIVPYGLYNTHKHEIKK